MSGSKEEAGELDLRRAELELRREIELTKIRNEFEIKQRETTLAEVRAREEDESAKEKKFGEFKTAAISIVAGVISAGSTIGVAYLGGFFEVAKTDATNAGTINLEKLKFSNDLVKSALQSDNPANSLLFYNDIGLLAGLNADNVKIYADREAARLKSGGAGESFLPSFDNKNRPSLWLNREFFADFTPNAKPEIIDALVSTGNYLLLGFGIDQSRQRLSMFLGQIAHETAGFSQFEETGKYSLDALRHLRPDLFDSEKSAKYAGQPEKILNLLYANRMGNGPEESGDGWRYRSRGFLQIAGRGNYERFSKETGIDLLNTPDAASDPHVSLLIATIYWYNNGMNKIADDNDFLMITRKIVGSAQGLESRRKYTDLAFKLLGGSKQ